MDHDWQMQVYPVVNFGQFTVRAIGSEPSVTAVRVLNTQGQPVDERLFEDPNNDIRISYDLSGQGAGTYTIVLMSDSEVLEHATTITVQR